MIPVLYIEENRDDSNKDWHFCILDLDEELRKHKLNLYQK